MGNSVISNLGGDGVAAFATYENQKTIQKIAATDPQAAAGVIHSQTKFAIIGVVVVLVFIGSFFLLTIYASRNNALKVNSSPRAIAVTSPSSPECDAVRTMASTLMEKARVEVPLAVRKYIPRYENRIAIERCIMATLQDKAEGMTLRCLEQPASGVRGPHHNHTNDDDHHQHNDHSHSKHWGHHHGMFASPGLNPYFPFLYSSVYATTHQAEGIVRDLLRAGIHLDQEDINRIFRCVSA